MRPLIAALLLLLFAVPAASAQYPGDVLPPTAYPGFSHVAGAYPDGVEGESIPAATARLQGLNALSWSEGSVLFSEGDRIRVVTPAGIVRTVADDDVDDAVGVIGGPGGFVVADAGTDTLVLFSGALAGGSPLVLDGVPDPFDVWDVAAGGPPTLGGTWGSLYVLDLDELGLASHTVAGWAWHKLAEPWDAHGIGERTGGGVLLAQRGGFGTEQDCRIYALAGGGPAPVAGSASCTRGGGVVGSGKPAGQVALNYPVDVEGTPDGGFVITEAQRLSRVAPDGTYTVLFTATGPDDLPIPTLDALDVTDDGDVIFSWGDQIWRYDGNFTGAPAPPPGGGSPTPPAQQPPPPPSGGGASTKPSATLTKNAYKVRRGKRLKLKVTASAAGAYKLVVLRKGKRVKRKSGQVRQGVNRIAFKAKLKPGAYKLRLTLTTATGTATDTATLKVRR